MRSGHISVKGLSIFIDEMKPDHECNSDGDILYITASGKRISWNTHKNWASLTTMARGPLIYAHYDDIGDPICSESVSCSICKESAIDQAPWL